MGVVPGCQRAGCVTLGEYRPRSCVSALGLVGVCKCQAVALSWAWGRGLGETDGC